MYYYRQMSLEQQREVMAYRRTQRQPWHSPPHWEYVGEWQFIVSGTCFEHAPVFGNSHQRLTECETDLLALCGKYALHLYAWCILPNHYHLLIKTGNWSDMRREIGKFHGRSAFKWNAEDNKRGRQVWHNCFERPIKSERHFWATMNYIHHNPVKHGYVDKWQDWPWSSAPEFLERVGRETALRTWLEYPILDYGKKWDVD